MKETVSGKQEELGEEGARRATDSPSSYESSEVYPERKRRRFTDVYKQKIIRKVRELREENEGGIGSFIRSEGLYYSTVQKWERSLSSGKTLKDNISRKNEELQKKVRELEKELARANKKLEKAEMIIDIQKKISILMQNQQEQ